VALPSYSNLCGDCLDVLKDLPDQSVQLIVTSPPYADQRKKTYGGIHPDKYVEWFMPRAAEFWRVLKPTGTFILNIKECVVDGERHTYVMQLVLALREQGWFWTEEWMWHKKNSAPGKWPNRFRDNWEHVFQFNLNRQFDMYQDEVRVPIGDWAKSRLTHLSEKDKTRVASATGSGFGKNVSNWVGRDTVNPHNVLHMASECGNKNHSAVFPVAFPEFFIKLFSKKGDTVADPFAGSGTTGVAALKNGRDYIGVELLQENVDEAEGRLVKALDAVPEGKVHPWEILDTQE
jgi:site-specific DNA-methyltransferase (adenine-specific)